jgi:hypothetical protein
MSTDVSVQTQVQTVRERILVLLDELPPENLITVEHFVQFLRDQARRGQPVKSVQEKRTPYTYPTVTTPPSSLDGWLDLVPEGYEGDALADTESLYDEV